MSSQLCFVICHEENPGKQVGLDLNGIHQCLSFADDVNLLEDNMDIIKNTENLFDASKKVHLGINVEETKYMLVSHHQNAGTNHNIKMAKRLFENVSQFRYLGMRVIHNNLIQREIKGELNSGNACFLSFHDLLFSFMSVNN
jgi:hypothetical protein